MTLENIKQISIREYLGQIGISPAKENDRYGMYHSPFREDKDASMKVDYNQNLWIDYGTGEGGSIIDLVSRIEKCSVGEAIKRLDDKFFSFQGKTIRTEQEPVIKIAKVQPIEAPALYDYLKERCINPDIAKQYCKEIHYTVNNKEYYAIGFQNDAGGYELRNKYFKGCTSKDISIIRSEDMNACLVFEGFMDYLSFLTMKNLNVPKQDAVILNSVHNLPKAMGFIKSHRRVYTYMDNDETGRKTTGAIKANCGEDTVSDQSAHYAGYKDLNDCLSAVKQARKPVKKQLGLKPKR